MTAFCYKFLEQILSLPNLGLFIDHLKTHRTMKKEHILFKICQK